MSGPLEGVRVVDLTTVLMGPFATQILGDMGADVVKIEPAGGDVVRGIGPARHPGMGGMFLTANRNKRSMVVDLKKPQGREIVLRLARDADIFIYNIRPQAMARLKLSYEDVKAVNPRIVYAGAYGFGQTGPYAEKAAYDDLIQGGVGIPALSAAAGGKEPHYVPSAMADRIVGMSLVNAVLSALLFRERTGQGQAVEVPMFETMAHFILGDHLQGQTFVPSLGPAGYPRLLSAHRRPFPTQDGHVCVLVYSDAQWVRFFGLIGEPSLAADPRFQGITNRTEHIDELYARVAAAMERRSTAEWIEVLEQHDIPVMRMHTMETLLEDPHLHAVGFFEQVQHPTEGTLRSLGTGTCWSASPCAVPRPAPRLGEHTRDVLAECGFSNEEIQSFYTDAVVN